jgi:hypothetical protein
MREKISHARVVPTLRARLAYIAGSQRQMSRVIQIHLSSTITSLRAVVATATRRTNCRRAEPATAKSQRDLRKNGIVGYSKGSAWEGRNQMTENHIKIRLLLDPTDWHGCSSERVWAEVLWGGTKKIFRLLNSPFYARGISHLDVVDALPAADGFGLDYAGTIQKSGNSNIWLLVPSPPPPEFDQYWSLLQRSGCTYESTSKDTEDGRKTLYAVDVPAEADIDRVLSVIEQGQARGVWIYQIGHLVRTAHNSIHQ